MSPRVKIVMCVCACDVNVRHITVAGWVYRETLELLCFTAIALLSRLPKAMLLDQVHLQ